MKTLTIALVAFVGFSCIKTADSPDQKIQSATNSSVIVQRDTGSAPIKSWWWDECTNERVNFTAIVHWRNILVYDGEYGSSHWYLTSSHTKLTDVKARGAKSKQIYKGVNINNYTLVQDSSFNTHFYAHYATLRIIAPGKKSSMILTQKVLLVTDKNGSTVVDMNTENSRCVTIRH